MFYQRKKYFLLNEASIIFAIAIAVERTFQQLMNALKMSKCILLFITPMCADGLEPSRPRSTAIPEALFSCPYISTGRSPIESVGREIAPPLTASLSLRSLFALSSVLQSLAALVLRSVSGVFFGAASFAILALALHHRPRSPLCAFDMLSSPFHGRAPSTTCLYTDK